LKQKLKRWFYEANPHPTQMDTKKIHQKLDRQKKIIELELARKHNHQSSGTVQTEMNNQKEKNHKFEKNIILMYRISPKARARNPIVFDRQRLEQRSLKLLVRSLKSELLNNSIYETTDAKNVTDLCGFEFYWWKIELQDQQLKVDWHRY
jgi:hypothetical protein